MATPSDRVTERQGISGKRRIDGLRIAVVEGLDRGLVETRYSESPLSVGVSPDNDLVLGDPRVSRYHLELRRTAAGFSVKDLGSLNGTFVNDLRVERIEAPPGTRLRLGGTVLLVEDAGATLAEDPDAADEIPGLVGPSVLMQELRQTVHKLAAVKASVLIVGETGTGKELVARAIHAAGPRRDHPFVVVDCGSMPATLIASELFGHERGAFTGADRRHDGAFERANCGTVFLDEVGELPLAVQPALLGVLERRRFRRLGGTDEISVDVRVLSATHRDLRAEANRGSFRPDLYFRLAIARVHLPPLRERPEDIAPLVRHFAQELTGSSEGASFDDGTMQALLSHRWTGNVRELRNVVESAIALGTVAFDASSSAGAEPVIAGESWGTARYSEARQAALLSFEARYLRSLMERCRGNASEAARRAAMDRPYLLSLLRRHGLR